MKIKKLKSLGKYFYPLTITDAITDSNFTDDEGTINPIDNIESNLHSVSISGLDLLD